MTFKSSFLFVIFFIWGHVEMFAKSDFCPNKDIEVLNAMGTCYWAEYGCEWMERGWRGLSIRDESDYRRISKRLGELVPPGSEVTTWTSGKKLTNGSWIWASTNVEIDEYVKTLMNFEPSHTDTRLIILMNYFHGIQALGTSEDRCREDRRYIFCEKCVGNW